MAERLEEDDAFYAEVGYFGSIKEDPEFLWSDPADPESDDAAELVRLLQERRAQLENTPTNVSAGVAYVGVNTSVAIVPSAS